MPVISIALMGFFAFGGGPVAALEATTGTAIAAETSEAPASASIALAEPVKLARSEAEAAYTVKLTSYNAVPEQTDESPTETASGVTTNSEVVAARSVDLAGALPFGTVVSIERTAADSSKCHFGVVEHLIGYRVIADSMHSRKREQIDVLLDHTDTVTVGGKEMNPSVALGVCSDVTIRVIGTIDLKDMPSTQEELRLMVEGDALAINK